MATTKPKEGTLVGKEKKAPSSNSHITSTTKKTTKPSSSSSSTTTSSSTNKAASTSSTPLQKNIPNYLKPTKSSRLESPNSFKQPKSDHAAHNNRPILNRRRSLENPISPSKLTKQTQPSPSRLQFKALESPPGPQRSIISTNPSKPISDRTQKTPRDGKKPQPLLGKSSVAKKSNLSFFTASKTQKVANVDASANNNSRRASITTSSAETTEEFSNVETHEEVKEVTNQEVHDEVVKVEHEEDEIENVYEVSSHVESEVHEHELEELSDEPHIIEDDDEKVIDTVSEEEAKQEPSQEEEHIIEEEKITDKDESYKNITDESTNHSKEHNSATEGELLVEVEVNEIKEDELGEVMIEDPKSDKNMKNEEEEEKKEAVELGVEEAKVAAESTATTPPKKQEGAALGQGKKKPQSPVSNDMIEETVSKLQLEARKNKVRALAGAFQTVIDYQTTSK